MTHIQMRIDGMSPSGEVWSTSLRYAGVSDLGQQFEDGTVNLGIFTTEILQDIADAAGQVIMDLGPSDALLQGMSSALGIETLRVNVISNDGDVTNAAEHNMSAAKMGVGAVQRPLQTSIVCTLNHGAVYGRSGRGRLFWPFVGANASMAGVFVDHSWRINFLTKMNALQAALGSAINDAALQSPPCQLVVYSPTLRKVRRVDNLSADNVPDTQRRRADRLPTTRHTIPRS